VSSSLLYPGSARLIHLALEEDAWVRARHVGCQTDDALHLFGPDLVGGHLRDTSTCGPWQTAQPGKDAHTDFTP
jgi:hypothetical protein